MIKIEMKKENTRLGMKVVVNTPAAGIDAELLRQSESTIIMGSDPKILKMVFNSYTKLGTIRMGDQVFSVDCSF